MSMAHAHIVWRRNTYSNSVTTLWHYSITISAKGQQHHPPHCKLATSLEYSMFHQSAQGSKLWSCKLRHNIFITKFTKQETLEFLYMTWRIYVYMRAGGEMDSTDVIGLSPRVLRSCSPLSFVRFTVNSYTHGFAGTLHWGFVHRPG